MADNNPSTVTTWITSVSTLAGVCVGILGQWLTSFTTTQRERDARTASQKDAAKQRQNDFQRETLLKMQDLAVGAGKTVNALLAHAQAMKFSSGSWSDNYSSVLITRFEDESFTMRSLVVRISNEKARLCGSKFIVAFESVFRAQTESTADTAHTEFIRLFKDFMDASGTQLRTLEGDMLAE